MLKFNPISEVPDIGSEIPIADVADIISDVDASYVRSSPLPSSVGTIHLTVALSKLPLSKLGLF